MDKSAAFKTIASQVTEGELAFPTTAQLALKVRRALEDSECPTSTVIQLVRAEPLLSARVVAIANSVAFNSSGREVTDVGVAVSRIGFNTVKSLAMALVTRQMAGRPATKIQQDMAHKLWEHTAHVAALAHAIASHSDDQDPETALFAGIVHEIGGFYLISRADDFPGVLDGDFTLWINSGEAKVSRAVLNVLSVPESVKTAMEGFWEGYMATPSASLSDILLLAEALAPIPSPLHRLADYGDTEFSLPSIEMAIGKDTLTHILEESAEAVASLTEALRF